MVQSNNERADKRQEAFDTSNKNISPDKKRNLLLRGARKARGLTQVQLAQEIGVDEKTICRWEAGECLPQPVHTKKLRDFFDMHPKDLGLVVLEDAQQSQEDHRANLSEDNVSELYDTIRGKEKFTTSDKSNNTNLQNLQTASRRASSLPIRDAIQPIDQELKPVRPGDFYHNGKIALPAHSFSHLVRMPYCRWVIPTILFIGLALLIMLTPVATHFLSPHSKPFQPRLSFMPAVSTVHREKQECTSRANKAGYLKISALRDGREEVFCFSGTGTLNISIDYVYKVEVGTHLANWTYLSLLGKRHISPTSADPGFYWCPRHARTYNTSIHILKISIAFPSTEMKCTNKTSLA